MLCKFWMCGVLLEISAFMSHYSSPCFSSLYNNYVSGKFYIDSISNIIVENILQPAAAAACWSVN